VANEKLNSEQLLAVKHNKGPLLIIAGAGTGKTTVVTERIKHLIIDKGVKPSEILALTFTEKAAAEMEERVDKEMPYGYTQMWISTFHSFCDRILRQEAIHIGLNPSYRLLTEAETILLLRKNLFKFNLKYFRPLGNPNKFLDGMLNHFSRLKDEDVSVDDYLKYVEKIKKSKTIEKEEIEKAHELANAYKTYEALKTEEGVMDFSDLISNTLKLFRTRKNILKEYQLQFKYILVDEFQDTNYSQNELAILLAGTEKNITVVGDDDQSIYRFRGSSISNIIQFKKRFPNTKIITLIRNYRSTEEILDTSYKLIQNNNPDRLEVKEKINKKLIAQSKKKGDPIKFIYTQRVEDEADLVAKKIKDLCEKEKFEHKDVAILIRANDHSQPFIRAFERHRIPFQFLGPGRLFQQEEVKDLISYLKVLYNFEDSVSLYRVLTMPIFKFESVEIASLLNLSKKRNYSLFEAMEKVDETFLKEEAKTKLQYLTKIIRKHLKLVPKETAGQILFYFLTDTGMIKNLIKAKTLKEDIVAKNIAKFFDKLKTYEVDHETASVFEVVDWIDLLMQVGESPLATDVDWTENNAVNILTVHSAKGLEFPIVFLTNLVAQRFPTRERKEAIPIPAVFIKEILPQGDFHLEEERRLFYVGMTRAKEKLFLTASSFYGEGKRERKLSPFVYETLGEEFIKKETTPAEEQLSFLDFNPPEIITEQPKTNIIPVTYLSYSQIQTFDICPLHYKLKYLLKIPTPQSSAQSFGTSIHSTLRDFYLSCQKGIIPSTKEVLNILDKNWVNEGYASKSHAEKAYEKAKDILETYLQNEFNKKKIPVVLEYPFNFTIKDLKVGGRIDRVDLLSDNKIEIIDYKTGNNLPDEKKLAKDMQLTIYALAATEVREKYLGKKPDEILLSLYYLEQGKKLTSTRTKEQLEEAKLEILKKADEISKSDFLCSRNMLCLNCEYKLLCDSHS
jgi:DNA helicase II / ATP-dependent DNA helicase PcrA